MKTHKATAGVSLIYEVLIVRAVSASARTSDDDVANDFLRHAGFEECKHAAGYINGRPPGGDTAFFVKVQCPLQKGAPFTLVRKKNGVCQEIDSGILTGILPASGSEKEEDLGGTGTRLARWSFLCEMSRESTLRTTVAPCANNDAA